MASLPQVKRCSELAALGYASVRYPNSMRPGNFSVMSFEGTYYKIGADGKEVPYTGPISVGDGTQQVTNGKLETSSGT